MFRFNLFAGRLRLALSICLASRIRLILFAALSSIALSSMPVIASAQNVPPLRVLLLPRLIPDATQQLLPIVFDSPANAVAVEPQKISVVALAYCGGDSAGGANAVGVAVPGRAPALSPSVLSASDCTAPLANVAARLMHTAGGPEWLEVIELHVAWTPWRLTLAIADASGAAKPGFTAPNLSHVGQIKSYNTSDIHLLTGRGSNIGFDVAVSFPGSAINVLAFPSGQVSNPFPYLNDRAVPNEIANAPAISNVIVEAQYTFINQILRLYDSSFEIPVPVEGVTETMTAKNITAAGADNGMTVAGNLEYRTLIYQASVRCAGEDLTVQQVTLDAPPANCNQDDLMAQLQCRGQGVASNAVASAITQYYQGQPLHVSTQTHPLDFAIGDNDYQATFDALKSSSHGGLFIEAGRATIRQSGPKAADGS